MTTPDTSAPKRSYGCTFACGSPYDIIIISVTDNSTEMLCLPCFFRLSSDMLKAMLDESDPETREAIALAIATRGEQVPGPSGNRRGRNAPANTEDPDLIDSFESFASADNWDQTQ